MASGIARKPEGPLLQQGADLREDDNALPIQQMNTEERLVSDYARTGLTVDRHPMSHQRKELRANGVLSSSELRLIQDGAFRAYGGLCHRPTKAGTAKGFIFLSMEDETGIANVIVTPDLFERDRLVVTRSRFLMTKRVLQNQDGVIHVNATSLLALLHGGLEVRLHDFH